MVKAPKEVRSLSPESIMTHGIGGTRKSAVDPTVSSHILETAEAI
jgi:hypothetical protein